MKNWPEHIFRAYDIRGIAFEDLTEEMAFTLGAALGTQTRKADGNCLVVGRDCRESGETLSTALMRGIISTGVGVVNIGIVPTPVVYWAIKNLKAYGGIVVTGSHNPLNTMALSLLWVVNLFAMKIFKRSSMRWPKAALLKVRGQSSHGMSCQIMSPMSLAGFAFRTSLLKWSLMLGTVLVPLQHFQF